MKSNRWWIAALVIVVGAGLWRLRFDADVLNLLPKDLPTVAGLKLYQENFANNREVVVTIESDSTSDAENTAKILSEKIRAKLGATAVWQPPWLDQPDATAEFLAWLWLSRPPEEVAALRARLNATNAPAALNETRERLTTSLSPLDLARLSHDPFGVTQLGASDAAMMNQGEDWFASKDGTFRLVFVQPAQAPKGYAKWGEWLDSLRVIVDEVAKTANVKIGLTGTPVFTVEAAQAMQGDMKQSIWMTLLMVGGLFWWAHRRFRPLGWMLLMLVSSLLITMAVGGLVFGELNVVSFGFAAILLGLGVDYSLVLYQELIGAPQSSAHEIREHAAAGIWWSAGTTALAFALLNFAGLPGLGQLGTLVAVGIMVAATAMLYGFLPMMTRKPPQPKPAPISKPSKYGNRPAWIITIITALIGSLVLSRAWPTIDHSAQPLGTINSQAEKVAKRIDAKMSHAGETHWVIISGRDEEEVRQRLDATAIELKSATNVVKKLDLPLPLWPHPAWQKQNLATLRSAHQEIPALTKAASEAGFTDEAIALTEKVANAWAKFDPATAAIWPASPATRWLIDRIAARKPNEAFALGMLQAPENATLPKLQTPGAYIASWSRLAEALLAKVQVRMIALTVAMTLLLVICLRLALRTWTEVLLSFATLAFGFMLTLLAMAALGWKWNLLSLTAIPLLLGAAVDYTIHVQMALHRYQGDAAMMRHTIGRALFLVTAAAVAGFGSLGFASNAGLASFELVCAVGMIAIFVTALYLLPAWHYTFTKASDSHG